jgi:DNA primase
MLNFLPNLDMEGPFLTKVVCPNPSHDTNKKHFQVNVNEALVHCFAGCGISGTYENAIMLIEGCDRATARKRILKHSKVLRSGDSISGNVRKGRAGAKGDSISTETVRPIPSPEEFSYLPPIATEYLERRKISGASIAKWELGWNPETKRITIPVRDSERRLKFYIERAVLESQFPKYLYPENARKSEVLYGACHFDPGMVRSFGVVVVEGSLDAILFDQNGVSTVGAILGSTLSKRQAEIIIRERPARVFTCFDRDTAGVGATFSVRKRITRTPIFVCRYPKHINDPGEIRTREEADRIIKRAIPYSTFYARTLTAKRGVSVG